MQTNEHGKFVIGIAWHEDVKFNLERPDGQQETAYSSGLPVVVVELTYGAHGPRTTGRVRLTRFPHQQDWTDKAIMENVLPWCLDPIVGLDPSTRISKRDEARIGAHAVPPPSPAPTPPSAPPPARVAAAPAAPRPGRPERFNPPPNWPVPPTGWAPPSDWQPDPSWPPASAGWRFWVA